MISCWSNHNKVEVRCLHSTSLHLGPLSHSVNCGLFSLRLLLEHTFKTILLFLHPLLFLSSLQIQQDEDFICQRSGFGPGRFCDRVQLVSRLKSWYVTISDGLKALANIQLAYNKWHETELDRWLTDHDIPHPKAADRKDLEVLVKDNWQKNVADPITEAGHKVADHYADVKDWIFDS